MLKLVPVLIGEATQTQIFAEEVVTFIKMMFSTVWAMFDINFPGTSIRIGTIQMGFAVVNITILIISIMFGFGNAESQRSKSTKKPKIPKERRRDEK